MNTLTDTSYRCNLDVPPLPLSAAGAESQQCQACFTIAPSDFASQ